MSFCLEREGGAWTICVRFYRILPSPEAPSARIVPDTIGLLVKRGTVEDVYAVVLQRLSDRAKTGLSASQSPGVEPHTRR